MKKFLLWFRILRPQTLFASICPVIVGLLAAQQHFAYMGKQGTLTFILTLLCALALQIFSNFTNDRYDFKRGSDKQGRVGFRRALAEGEVNENEMKIACYIALSIAIILGAMLIVVGGWIILLIGLTAILFAWLYTATTHSLSYLGIADIFVFLYYGVIASVGTTFLLYRSIGIILNQTNAWQLLSGSFYAGAVCGLISMCVLAINNIRDMEDDRTVGKRTFAVRFGRKAALVGLAVIIALMPICSYLAFGWNYSMLIILPAAYLLCKIIKAHGTEYNRCLMGAGLVNVCYTILVWITLL